MCFLYYFLCCAKKTFRVFAKKLYFQMAFIIMHSITSLCSFSVSLIKSIAAGGIFGVRHLQAFLLFLGLTLAYAMRVNLSVAIVAITDKHAANAEFEVCCNTSPKRVEQKTFGDSNFSIEFKLLSLFSTRIVFAIHRTTNGMKRQRRWCWAASFGVM